MGKEWFELKYKHGYTQRSVFIYILRVVNAHPVKWHECTWPDVGEISEYYTVSITQLPWGIARYDTVGEDDG